MKTSFAAILAAVAVLPAQAFVTMPPTAVTRACAPLASSFPVDDEVDFDGTYVRSSVHAGPLEQQGFGSAKRRDQRATPLFLTLCLLLLLLLFLLCL